MDGNRSSQESGGRKIVSQGSAKKRSTKEDKGSPEEKVKLSSIPDSKSVPIEHSGNLHKQGRLLKKWKPRFFQIQGNCLYYFKNYERKECLGFIDLQKCYYAGKSTTVASFGCAFELQTWGRTHLLAARDEREAERWITIMKKKMVPEARDRDKKGTKGDVDATIPSEMRTRRATIKMNKSNKKGGAAMVDSTGTSGVKPSTSAHEMQMSKLTALEEYEDMDVKTTPGAGGVTASQSVPEFKSNSVSNKDALAYDEVKDAGTGKQAAPYDPVTPGTNSSKSQQLEEPIPEYEEEYIQNGATTTSGSTDYEEMQQGPQPVPMKVPPREHKLPAQVPGQQLKQAPPPPQGANPPIRGAPPPPQPVRVPSEPEEQPPPPPKRGASFKHPSQPSVLQQPLHREPPDPLSRAPPLPPPVTQTQQPPLYDTPPHTQQPLYDTPPQTQPPLYDTPPVMADIPETPPIPMRDTSTNPVADFDSTPSPPKRTASLSRHGDNGAMIKQPVPAKRHLRRQAMSVADIELPPLIPDDIGITDLAGLKRSNSVSNATDLPPLLDLDLFNLQLPQEGADKQAGNEYTTMNWLQPMGNNDGGTALLPPLNIDLGSAELPPIIKPRSEPLPDTSNGQLMQPDITDMQLLPPDMTIGTASSLDTSAGSMLLPVIEPPLPDTASNQQGNVADMQLLPPDMTTPATNDSNVSSPPTQNIADFSAFDLPPLDNSSGNHAHSIPPTQDIADLSAFDLPPFDSNRSSTRTSPAPPSLPPLVEIPELPQDEQLLQLPPTTGVDELRQRLPPSPLASISDIPSPIDQLRYLLANDPQHSSNNGVRHHNVQLPPEDKPWLTEQTGVEQLRRFLTINST